MTGRAPNPGATASRPKTPARAARALQLAVAAIVLLVAGAYLGFGLMTAGRTLGCDYIAYHGAAARFLVGGPIYDPVAAWILSAGCSSTRRPLFFSPSHSP